jgi:hypothetical protein
LLKAFWISVSIGNKKANKNVLPRSKHSGKNKEKNTISLHGKHMAKKCKNALQK